MATPEGTTQDDLSNRSTAHAPEHDNFDELSSSPLSSGADAVGTSAVLSTEPSATSPGYSAKSATPPLLGISSPSELDNLQHDTTHSTAGSPAQLAWESDSAACQQSPSPSPPDSSRTRHTETTLMSPRVGCSMQGAKHMLCCAVLCCAALCCARLLQIRQQVHVSPCA